MGATFSSIQVRVASQEAVIEGLRGSLEEPAYVSPPVGGWVGVYPEGAMGTDALAAELSCRLSAAVFDWNVYDSDVFFYSLYENGGLRDEFNSAPGYFEAQAVAGDEEGEQERIDPAQVRGAPEALLPYCAPGTTLAAIKEVLQPTELAEPNPALATQLPGFPEANLGRLAAALDTTADALRQGIQQKMREKYTFAEHQASDLALLLGMDEELAQGHYSDIAQDDLEDHDQKDFHLVGNENLSQGYKNGKLWTSFQVGDLEAAVRAGAEVNARDGQGVPLLFRVARYCVSESIQFLVGAGAEANAATPSADADPARSFYLQLGVGWEGGVTPLMVAAGASVEHPTRQLESIQTLIDAGANVNARGEARRTALSEALGMTDPAQHQGKIGRRAPAEVLRQAAERSAQVVEMLRAAGAQDFAA